MADWRTLVARGLAVLWAGFWLFFFIVESVAWDTPVARMAPWVGAGLLFVLLVVVAWRSELKGGLLLVVTGVLTGLAYAIWSPEGLPLLSRLLTLTTLGLPPIVAGLLLLAHHRATSAW